jgi:hypothetical protein
VLAIVIGLFVSSVPFAVVAVPPPKKDCAQEDVFERLVCRQAGLSDQMEYTSDTVFADGTKLHQNAKKVHLDHLNNSKKKLLRANKKSTKETFKIIAKGESRGNKKTGHLIPLDDILDDAIPQGGDGICDYEQGNENAQCAAIELDEFGQLQTCNPKKKNKGKGKGGVKFEGLECDLFDVTEEGSSPDEQEDMDEAAEQMDATYSAMEDDLIEANESLDYINENLPENFANVLSTENGCDIPSVDPELSNKVHDLRLAYASVFGAARIAADIGGQNIPIPFDGSINSRWIAIAVDAAALAVNIVYIVSDEAVKKASADKQEAIAQCVSKTASDIADLRKQMIEDHSDIMANDDQNTETIVTNLEKVRAEVVNLLNTPQGRRDWFPIK